MDHFLDRVSAVLEMGHRQMTADRILDWTIRNRLFDLGGLTPAARAASWFGYGSLLTLLGSMVGLEVIGVRLPTSGSAVAVETASRVPLQVVVIACVGFVAAWSLILTGALYARSGIAVIGLIVFGIQIIAIGSRIVFASLLLIALAICLQVVIRAKPAWRDWNKTPVASLLLWLLLLGGLVVLAWTAGPSVDGFTLSLGSVMSMANVLAIGLWLAMGCGAIITAVRLSVVVVGYLHRYVSRAWLGWLAIVGVCLLGPVEMIFGIVERDPAWIIGGLISLSLIPALAILVLTRRWTSRRAAVMTGLCITIVVFTFGLSLALSDISRIGRGVQASGIFPPVLLFLALAADHLLRFGKPINRMVLRLGSQVAWVLIYLGVIVLVLASLLFLMYRPSSVNGRIGQPLPASLAGLTLAAMFISAPVYVVWVLCRRREWWVRAGES